MFLRSSTYGLDGRAGMAQFRGDDIDWSQFPQPYQLPRNFGPYELTGVLGEGGMGCVYRGVELESAAMGVAVEVAIKVPDARLLRTDPLVGETFLREARSAARVRHANVVTLMRVGQVTGIPYLAMELLNGLPLDEFMRKIALEPAHALRIGHGMLQGLSAVHEAGLVHRDVKPSNLFVTRNGSTKLLDLGIARGTGATGRLTQEGMAKGTPGYMAPEPFLNKPIGPWTDLFSAAIVLAELVLGDLVFDADSTESLIAQLLDVSEHLQQLDLELRLDSRVPGLGRLVAHMLATDPSDRPGSAEAVVDELEALQRRVPETESLRRVVRRALGEEESADVSPTRSSGRTGQVDTLKSARAPTPSPPTLSGSPVSTPRVETASRPDPRDASAAATSPRRSIPATQTMPRSSVPPTEQVPSTPPPTPSGAIDSTVPIPARSEASGTASVPKHKVAATEALPTGQPAVEPADPSIQVAPSARRRRGLGLLLGGLAGVALVGIVGVVCVGAGGTLGALWFLPGSESAPSGQDEVASLGLEGERADAGDAVLKVGGIETLQDAVSPDLGDAGAARPKAPESTGGTAVDSVSDSASDDAVALDSTVVESQVKVPPFPLKSTPTKVMSMPTPTAQSAQYLQQGEPKRMESIATLEDLLGRSSATGERKAELMLRLAGLYYEQSVARSDADFRSKAVDTFQQILESYPRYSRADEATYYLAVALRDGNRGKEGVDYFAKLNEAYPDSGFLSDANMHIGEYYFDNNVAKALQAYKRAIVDRDSPNYSFAKYKLAWCYYNAGEHGKAIAEMKAVVAYVQTQKSGANQLQDQALGDLVRFFADAGEINAAYEYFGKLGKNEMIVSMLERLTANYYEQGKYDLSVQTARRLIVQNPSAPRAVDYQAAIVVAAIRKANTDEKFQEIDRLERSYGSASAWARSNSRNSGVIRHAQATIAQFEDYKTD
ncbi:MAG: serine/threonine protein kinase/tetratricopeptide (TPR) repeat protein [Kiritimatiellia bacterium]